MCNHLKHLLKTECCFSAGIVLQELLSKGSRKHSTDGTRNNLNNINEHYGNLRVVWRKMKTGENKTVPVSSELTGYSPPNEKR